MGFFFKDELRKRDDEQTRQLDRGTEPNVTIGDVGQAVKSSVYDAGAMVNAGIRAVTGSKAAEFREKRDALRSERVTQNLSPGGRAMASGTVLPDENGDSAFLRNPIGYVTFNGAKQAPMLVLSAIPGAAIGRGVALAAKGATRLAAGATAGTTAVTGGALNAGDVLHGIYSELDKMTKKDWSKVPAYLDLVRKGYTYEKARDEITDNLIANAGALAFAVGTVLNSFGVGQTLAKAGAGTIVKEGFKKGLAKGTAEEFAQEFGEEGSGNLIQQHATKFDDDYDWKQAFEAATAGGVVGGIIGGGVSGVTNIKSKTPKVPVVAPGNAPSATQAAAVTGAPLPPPAPPKTSPTAPAATVGPPVVAAGAHTPPPGVVTKGKNFKKKPKAAAAPVVAAPVVADTNQAAALAATTPAPVVQTAPEVAPPPPVTQNVTPPPIIQNAQNVQQAPPPIVQNAQNVQPAPQIIRKRAQQEIAPPAPAPVIAPPVTPIENVSVPPAPVEQVPVGSSASRLPQVLPDLAAEQRRAQQFEEYAQQPDDVASRGNRYELGQIAEEVNDPAKHQAWRRLMAKEAAGLNPSDIAVEAASIAGKVGNSLTPEQKTQLKMLNAAWIDSKKEAKRGNNYYEEPAPRKPDDSHVKAQKAFAALTPAEQELVRVKIGMRDLDAETSTIERKTLGSVGMGTTDIVDDSGSTNVMDDTDSLSSVGVVSEASTTRESDNDAVAVAAKAKAGVAQRESEGPASEVRKVELSAEEKAAYAAKYNTKPKTKEEIAAATPKAPEPKVTQSVTPKVEPKPVPKKEAAPSKKVVEKQQKRKEGIEQAGKDLLKLRREQQAAARSGDPRHEELMVMVNAYRAGVKATYGSAAHDQINKDVETLLKNEKMPAMAQRIPATNLNTLQKLKNVFRNRTTPEIYTDKTGEQHKAIRTTTVREMLAEMERDGSLESLHLFEPVAQGAQEMMLPRLIELAGDVKIHIIDPRASVLQTPKFVAAGMYDSDQHVILVGENNFNNPGWAANVVIHEVAHAAFWREINFGPERPSVHLEYLRKEIVKALGKPMLKKYGVDYGFTNIHEMVSEAWSNPDFQRFLAAIPLEDNIAIKMGLTRFKKYSVWSGFLEVVRKTLKWPEGQFNVLDAVVSATSHYSSGRLKADDDHYWKNVQDEVTQNIASDFEFDTAALPESSDMAPMRQMQGKVLQVAKEKVSNSVFRRLQLGLTTLHQLAQMTDKWWPKGMGMAVYDSVGSIDQRRQELLAGGRDQIVALSHQMGEKFKGPVFEKFIDLTHSATSAAVNIAVPLTHPDNVHIKKGFTHSNSRAVHKELHGEWNKLPAELKDLWNKEVKYFRETQDTLSLTILNDAVTIALGRVDTAISERIHNGTMTEADRALFRTNAMMKFISETKELKKINGYYTPKMRRGGFVLSGEYIIPSKWDAHKLKKSKNKFVFDTRKEAENFMTEMRSLGMIDNKSKPYSVDIATGNKHYTYTDPQTDVTQLGPDGLPKEYRFSRGDTGTKEIYEVTVQNKMMEMFDNKAKGAAAEAEYRAEGKFKINGLQEKEEFAANSKAVTTSQMNRVISSLEHRENFQNKSDTDKALFKQTLRELSLGWMMSNNIGNRAKPRRNVLGASREHARNVAEYSAASSSSIAQSEKRAALAAAMTDLENYHKDHSHEDGSRTLPRSEILAQFRRLIDNQEFKKPAKWNAVVNGLLRVAFLKHLASPAYVMINLTQTFMLSLPTIGGRHGVVRTSMALTKAYEDMGFMGIMGAGIRDTGRAVRDLFTGMSSPTADYIGDLHKRLATQPDGKELTDMLDYIYNTNLMNRDAGIEIAELITKPGMLNHVARSVEHIARQTSVAAEIANRTATAVSAFRLERKRGASYEEAKSYAQKIVGNTQGIYSYSNAPEFFKIPIMAIPLQFRKYSQLYYNLLGNMVHQTLKGATRAEKIEAGKQLGLMFITHVAMAGALGLPTEPLKVIFAGLGWIGVPIPTWDEIERMSTEYAMNMFGENLGDALVHGLPRLAGIDLHTRVGANSMILFGTPEEAKEDEWNAWIAKTVMGAPGGVIADALKAKEAAEEGDWGKAAALLVPIKAISDSVKAAESYTVGKSNARGKQVEEPSGLGSAAVTAFGLKPAWRARQQEATSAYYAESRKRDEHRQELIDAWKNSTGSRRRDAQKAIAKFNKNVPKETKITGATLARSLKADKNYSKHGIYPGRRNKDLLERFLGE